MMTSKNTIEWKRVDGSAVSCTESVKVLNENWIELSSMMQDVFEDAVLMGVGKDNMRRLMRELVDGLDCPYKEKTAPVESISREQRRP